MYRLQKAAGMNNQRFDTKYFGAGKGSKNGLGDRPWQGRGQASVVVGRSVDRCAGWREIFDFSVWSCVFRPEASGSAPGIKRMRSRIIPLVE